MANHMTRRVILFHESQMLREMLSKTVLPANEQLRRPFAVALFCIVSTFSTTIATCVENWVAWYTGDWANYFSTLKLYNFGRTNITILNNLTLKIWPENPKIMTHFDITNQNFDKMWP